MAHYIGDCDGGFCKVAVEMDLFIEKIAEDGYLKDIYRETLFAFEYNKSIEELVKMGMLSVVGDDPEYTIDEVGETVEALKMAVIEYLGADAALEAEADVARRWDEVRESIINPKDETLSS